MAQLAGNGILQFTHANLKFDELLPAESGTSAKWTICWPASAVPPRRRRKRQAWAARAKRDFFHTEMNSKLYAQYIVEGRCRSRSAMIMFK
ncbi:MAG: hypothetical protein R3F38_19270 [Gammaproteobacteria bacterium]